MTLSQIRVLHNRLLVLLPSKAEEAAASGLILARALPPPVTCGRVLKVGPAVRDVHAGDWVAFSPSAGDPLPLSEKHEAIFLRETEITAVLPTSTKEHTA